MSVAVGRRPRRSAPPPRARRCRAVGGPSERETGLTVAPRALKPRRAESGRGAQRLAAECAGRSAREPPQPRPPRLTRGCACHFWPWRTGEGLEPSRGVAELEAEGLAQRDVALDVGGQHGGTAGHGWAISDRRQKSTLAEWTVVRGERGRRTAPMPARDAPCRSMTGATAWAQSVAPGGGRLTPAP